MRLDERGKQCPLPVIEAKKALEKAEPGTVLEVVVDNEIAVQNLKKMAFHKGFESVSQKVSGQEFIVSITAASLGSGEEAFKAEGKVIQAGIEASKAAGTIGRAGIEAQKAAGNVGQAGIEVQKAAGNVGQAGAEEETSCQPDIRDKGMVVILSSDQMGQGDEVLGRLLMKGFVYALAKQDRLPETVLLYNGGASLSCEGSDSLEDLREMEAQGVEVLTCGTCLNHYGLAKKLAVGSVTNMYEIAERMTGAKKLVRP